MMSVSRWPTSGYQASRSSPPKRICAAVSGPGTVAWLIWRKISTGEGPLLLSIVNSWLTFQSFTTPSQASGCPRFPVWKQGVANRLPQDSYRPRHSLNRSLEEIPPRLGASYLGLQSLPGIKPPTVWSPLPPRVLGFWTYPPTALIAFGWPTPSN